MQYKKRKFYSAFGRTAIRTGARAVGRYVRRRAVNAIGDWFVGKKSSPETGVTAQFDAVTQYRKKNMPRGKKRVWKKFVRKVNAVVDKSLGTRTVIFNNEITQLVAPGTQGYMAATLYGFCGQETGQNTGFRDIYRICNKDNDIMTNSTEGGNPSKILFKSGVIDLTMRNMGSTAMELDVYEINVYTDDTKESNFTESAISAASETQTIPGGPTGLNLNQRGVTLFDLPNLISQERLKIIKKRKYFLPAGNTATLQHRDPRNHWFNAIDIDVNSDVEYSSYARRKMTIMFVFIPKEITGGTVGCNLHVGVTRKYAYTINQSSKAFDSYNP
jgi:hypothetical protein